MNGPDAIAGVDLHTLLLVAGVLAGHFFIVWRAGQIGLDSRRAAGFSATILVAAALGGHVLFLILEPGAWDMALANPILLLDPFAGGFSFGCLVGAAAGGAFYLWRYRMGAAALFNAGAWVFPFAWFLVRNGCYWTHEPLALIEVIHSFVLAGVFWGARKKPWPFAVLLLVTYGAVRIIENTQREGQHRTDQVGAWLMLAAGVAWWVIERRNVTGFPRR